MKNIVRIPYRQLSPEAFQRLIEEIITRDGSDYGEVILSLEQKVAQVLRQLESGMAVITYDEKTQTSNIMLKKDYDRLTGTPAGSDPARKGSRCHQTPDTRTSSQRLGTACGQI